MEIFMEKEHNIFMNKYQVLKDIINESSSIVVFTGAGISTPSGIPDFRSADGIYNQKYKYEKVYQELFLAGLFDD